MSETLVIIQPTSFCNISCKYCYLPVSSRNAKNFMSISTLERIFIDVFRSKLISNPIELVYHAGEPLTVSKQFYKTAFSISEEINKYYGRQYSHSIQTNATLIDEEWAEIFNTHSVKIGVSVDGPAFIHDQSRVTRNTRPTHSKVMKGIKTLQEFGVKFNAIMVLTYQSLDHADEIYDFFVSNNILSIGFNIDEFGSNDFISSYISNAAVNKFKQFTSRFLYLVDRDGGLLRVREFEKMSLAIMSAGLGIDEIYRSTNIPLKIITFDTKGNYSTFDPELMGLSSSDYNNFVMGNIFTQGIDDIFSNPTFIKVHQEIQNGLDSCHTTCEYWKLCGGGTPSSKFFELGRINASETLTCRIHIQALADTMLSYLRSKIN